MIEKNEDYYPLILSRKFYNILQSIDDEISKYLIKCFKDGVLFKETFIDITIDNDIVSFLPSEVINRMMQSGDFDKKEVWISGRRISTRIGRLILRLTSNKFSEKSIESFVNSYKARIEIRSLFKNFRLVEGDEIKKWYLSDNYVPGGGTLNNSCMAKASAQNFFDIYTKNPEKIKLLILLNEEKKLILGRALIWFLDSPKQSILMDRIYYSEDYILNVFIDYATKNGWYYKVSNENPLISVMDGTPYRVKMWLRIKKYNYEKFPFVDNMGFFEPKKFILTNDPKYLKKIGSEYYYDLCDNFGGYEIRNDFEY